MRSIYIHIFLQFTFSLFSGWRRPNSVWGNVALRLFGTDDPKARKRANMIAIRRGLVPSEDGPAALVDNPASTKSLKVITGEVLVDKEPFQLREFGTGRVRIRFCKGWAAALSDAVNEQLFAECPINFKTNVVNGVGLATGNGKCPSRGCRAFKFECNTTSVDEKGRLKFRVTATGKELFRCFKVVKDFF